MLLRSEVLAEWDKQNGAIVDAYFSVNVSAIQLVRDDVAGVVRQALEKHKIGGERLMIELTESAIIGDPDLALSVLSELKALDARVAMDDFGTGYSNLAYLQRLPIDVLKRSEEHTSELQSLMRISYAVFCLKKKKKRKTCHQLLQPHNDHTINET